jgi:MFS family permease
LSKSISASQKKTITPYLGGADPGGLGACPQKDNQRVKANQELVTISVTLLNFVQFLIGRSIKGLAIGLLSSLLPLYTTEVFLDTHVSYVLTSYQSALPFGIFFNALVAAVGFCGEMSLLNFNHCWMISALPVSSVLCTCFFIRTSPLDLFKAEKEKKLVDSVEEVYGIEKLKEAIDDLSTRATKSNLKSDFKNLFTSKSSSNRLLYATLPQIMVQMTGINILMYYITYICQSKLT